MSCPDEDTFARFVEGLLAPSAAGEIERHVDTCPRCADLAAEFGRSFAEPNDKAAAPEQRLAALALAVGAVLHVAWGVVLTGTAGALERLAPSAVTSAYLHYAQIWAPLGGAVALVAALCLMRGWRLGRILSIGHAVLSLPSIVLTPLVIFILDAQRRDHARQETSERV
jgi:anti-sigma factor RsiW